ncbi:MAG: diguanylate cyclase [Gaiellales bacterium]|nr:diguanylate cyclase [Gaiellales bacterium]
MWALAAVWVGGNLAGTASWAHEQIQSGASAPIPERRPALRRSGSHGAAPARSRSRHGRRSAPNRVPIRSSRSTGRCSTVAGSPRSSSSAGRSPRCWPTRRLRETTSSGGSWRRRRRAVAHLAPRPAASGAVGGQRLGSPQARSASPGAPRRLLAGEFEVHYQPKLNIESGRLDGVEALVRWRRGDQLVPPGSFLPEVEQPRLIRDLTLVVLDTALADTRRWEADGVHVRIAVNIAPVSLADPRLVNDVAGALERDVARARCGVHRRVRRRTADLPRHHERRVHIRNR